MRIAPIVSHVDARARIPSHFRYCSTAKGLDSFRLRLKELHSELGGCILSSSILARRDARGQHQPPPKSIGTSYAARTTSSTAPIRLRTSTASARTEKQQQHQRGTHRAQRAATESTTRTGCRAGEQQQEHRHYDAENELTQRAANPARADNGARRDQEQTKIATEAGVLISKHRIQRNTLTHTLVVVQFHSVQVHVYTCTSYPLWGL